MTRRAGRRARSGRAASGLLVAAVVAGGLAASLGAGYTVAQATLDDASTYVAKGNAVSHVNGESHQVDATSPGGLADVGSLEDVDTTPLPNGKVVAVNRQTGKVSVIDGSTLNRTTAMPGSTSGPVKIAPQVVATHTGGWLLDYASRTVRQVGGGDEQQVKLDGKPVDGAPGRGGALIVLTEPGQLYEVGRDHSVRPLDIPTGDGRGGALTTVGDHSYLVQTGGTVVQVDSERPVNVAAAAGASPFRDGRMLVNSPRTGGPHLLVVVREQVEVVDLGTGEVAAAIVHRAGTDQLGEPVEYRGRIYLPNYETHRLIVLDEKTKAPVGDPMKIPGNQKTFFVSVDGGKLWANDQYSNRMIEIDADGLHTIDKGKGNGVRGDAPKKRTPPTRGGTTAPPPGTTGGTPGSTTTPPTSTPPSRVPPVKVPVTPPQAAKKIPVPDIAPGSNYQDACDKIEAVELICQAVAVGDDGGDTDTVKDVRPGPGTELPEGSQVVVTYYGPTTVPQILNTTTTPADQCKAIVEATLTCDPQAAPDAASSLDQFGFVADTSPAPGDEADRGDKVTVYYYDSFTMPQFANTDPGTPGASTCDALTARVIQLPDGMTRALQCTAPEGPKENNQPVNAGKVYEQVPAAGANAQVDQPITLTVYGGMHAVANYAADNGGDAGFAQADCQKWFSACDLVTGTVPVGHPQDAGKVERTDPAAGTNAQVGSPVHIVVFASQTSVPAITGLDIATACQKVAEAGLVCDRDSSHPDAKQAGFANPPGYPSSPAENTSVPLGTTVVVPNATTPTKQIFAYPNADGTVFVVRPAGDSVPTGYDAARGVLVTTGYAIGAHPNWDIHEFYCGNCDGHAPNHFVSHGGRGTQSGTPWEAVQNSGGSVAGLLPASGPQTCNTAIGQIGIWRVSNDRGNGRIDYGIVAQDANPGTRYPEFLGCGWK